MSRFRANLPALVLAMALLALASGCTKSAVVPTLPERPDASVMARSGALILSLRVDPVRASVGETVTATVSYRNTSGRRQKIIAPALAVCDVRVTDVGGKAVFDSSAANPDGTGPARVIDLAPGATSTGKVGLRLDVPGDYDVAAYAKTALFPLPTPSVRIIVTK